MGRRIPGWIRTAAGVVACALLACAQGGGSPGPAQPTPPAQPPEGPLLWRADPPSGRGAYYLLGSVHLGDGRMLRLGEEVDSAYAASEELVVEIDVTRVTREESLDLIHRYGYLAQPLTLEDVISEGTYIEFAAYLDRSGVVPGPIHRFKPWFLSFTIVQHELQKAGYDPSLGVDRILLDGAAGKKPIVALETMASQLEVFDSMSADIQELMLRDTLARVDDLPRQTEELIAAWRAGDAERLHQLVFEPLADAPELEVFYERVFFERNRAMVSRLVELGGDGKTRLVVLGAGHMVGDRGIPALLGRKGYRVGRVRR